MYSQACLIQHRQLSAAASGALLPAMRWCFLAAAAGFGLYGLIGGHPWSTMVGVFFAVLTAGSWQSVTHLRRALQAFDSPLVVPGQVVVSTREWSDTVHYEARVSSGSGQAWAFEFLPLGRPPSEGAHDCRLHHLPGRAWPALVSLEAGLLVPRYTPKPAMPET